MTEAPEPGLRAAITDVLVAAKFAKDDEDAKRFAHCWARNARIEITSNGRKLAPVEGRAAIMAFYAKVWETGGHGKGAAREVHVAEPADIIALAPDRLRARHAEAFFFADADGPRIRGFGTFDDEVVWEDGAWRIVHRIATLTRNS
ncbi:MAG: nuclear transport factor 2 family protein [Rhodobiaceae bacterium]|nr:nuclear transport factor 2 family protein [Novosphingobium sp.]MCC0057622.1 nuclear transport factor 2 family protein [Rhodobiaceae bacterium]